MKSTAKKKLNVDINTQFNKSKKYNTGNRKKQLGHTKLLEIKQSLV